MRPITAAVVAATAATIVVSSSFAIAAIPDSATKLITVCYTKTSGALRLIDKQAGKACNTKTELELSWNQQGVKGDIGLPGAPGVAGVKGDPGTPGVNGLPGAKGDAGTNGAPGAVGAPGPAGAAGANGTNGVDGTPGAKGDPGLPGVNGVDGAPGPAGPAGADGGFYLKDGAGVTIGKLVEKDPSNYFFIVWTGTKFKEISKDGGNCRGSCGAVLYFANAGCSGTPYMRPINSVPSLYGPRPLIVSGAWFGFVDTEISLDPPVWANMTYVQDPQGGCSYNSVGPNWASWSTFSVVATYPQHPLPLSISATP